MVGAKTFVPTKNAAGDQLDHRRALDQDFEDIAQASTIGSGGRCRDADHHRFGVGLQQTPIRPRGRVVRFVDDDQIGRRQVHRRCADRPRVERGDRGHLNPLSKPWGEAGEDDAVIYAAGIQLAARLTDQFAAMRKKLTELPPAHRITDNSSSNDGFAGAGRGHHQKAAIACSYCGVDALDQLPLIGTQLRRAHGAPPIGLRSSRPTSKS